MSDVFPELPNTGESLTPASSRSTGSPRYAICRVVETSDNESMGMIEALRELDAETVDAFRTALDGVRRHMQFDLLQLAYLNLMGHGELLDRLLHSAEHPLGLVRGRSTESAQMVLANLFSFCSSMHAVQDHSEARARRLGGDALCKRVRGLFSAAYDAGEEIFFVRRLRDVLVHSDFGVFDYNASYVMEEPGGPPVARSQTYFVRSALLPQSRFNTRIREWLSGQDDKFPILPVLEAAFDQLHAMYSEVVMLTNPDLFKDAAFVTSVCRLMEESIGGTADLLIYPATPEFRPDEEHHERIIPLYPEVIAYARALVSHASEAPTVV